MWERTSASSAASCPRGFFQARGRCARGRFLFDGLCHRFCGCGLFGGGCGLQLAAAVAALGQARSGFGQLGAQPVDGVLPLCYLAGVRRALAFPKVQLGLRGGYLAAPHVVGRLRFGARTLRRGQT